MGWPPLFGTFGVKIKVFEIIEHYFPKKRIPPKTQYFIEEILAG